MMRISSMLNAQTATDPVGLHKQIYGFGKQLAIGVKEAALMGQSALVVRMATALAHGFTALHECKEPSSKTACSLHTSPPNWLSVPATESRA